MFKKILEALSTQYKGVDAKVLVRMARKLAKKIKSEDEIEDKVAEVTMQDFIDMEGDRRATEAQTSAVANYEKKYGLKNGKKANGKAGDDPTVDPDDDDDDDIDEDDDIDDPDDEPVARNHRKPDTKNNRRISKHESALEKQVAQLTQSMQKLTGMFEEMKTEKTTKTRRQQYEELFEGADEKTKSRYLRDFDRMQFKDDEDYENWLTERAAEISEELKDLGIDNSDDDDNVNGGGQAQQGAGATKPTTTTGAPQTHQPARTAPSGARPPLGGRRNTKPGTVSPSVQNYIDAQAQREASQQFSTIAGIPQVQTPAVPAAGAGSIGGQQ